MAYSQAIKEGTAESRDLQVLLVGAESVENTSLISSFLGEEFVARQLATGVEMCKLYKKMTWRSLLLYVYSVRSFLVLL